LPTMLSLAIWKISFQNSLSITKRTLSKLNYG
jgi:hypothetical protein